jgi:predicted phage terminase large subunit-like protein
MIKIGTREEVQAKCCASIEVFGKICMPKIFYARTPEFHRRIYTDLQDQSIKKLGIIAPRGHSKSTVASVLYPMWEILRKPQGKDMLIILISESQDQSKNFLSIIKHNLAKNPAILHYFGSVEGPKWAEEEITTSNDVRIMARGTLQKMRGTISGTDSVTRPNIIILDDFESETNSGTPEACEKNKTWITKAVEPSLADDGRLIAIGTIIGQRAYLQDIRKDTAWKTHFYQAAIGNNFSTPLWPERFSTERLTNIKDSLEARGKGESFWQEYQNEPIDLTKQTFKQSMLIRHSGIYKNIERIQSALLFKEAPRPGLANMTVPVSVSIGVDLAISESHRADWTVIMPVATDWESYRYTLPYTRLQTGDVDVIVEAMIAACMKYKASIINIETVQFQQAVANAFRKAMEKTGVYVGIKETKPRTSKDSRIRALQPMFASGKIFLAEGSGELESELLNFPNGANDDTLDALYMAVDASYPPEIKPFMGAYELPQPKKELSWLVL